MMNASRSRVGKTLAVAFWLAATVAAPAAEPQTPQAPANASAADSRVVITAGRSTVLTTDFDVSRIAVTNPGAAADTVVSPREGLIDGKAPGTISLIIWAQPNAFSTTLSSIRVSVRFSSSSARCSPAKTSK